MAEDQVPGHGGASPLFQSHEGWGPGSGTWFMRSRSGGGLNPPSLSPWPRWPPAQRTQPSPLHLVLPVPPASRGDTIDKQASGLWCPTPVHILCWSSEQNEDNKRSEAPRDGSCQGCSARCGHAAVPSARWLVLLPPCWHPLFPLAQSQLTLPHRSLPSSSHPGVALLRCPIDTQGIRE